jgi:hypothetical protein
VAAAGASVRSAREEAFSLEDVFISVVEKARTARAAPAGPAKE